MKILKSGKLIDMSQAEFKELVTGFDRVALDLGCGDGRFIYKKAISDAKTLYIGIDPAIKQAQEYASKMARKRLNNLLFVSGSLEQLPVELTAVADELFIILPWGSLLGGIANPTDSTVGALKGLLKNGATLETIFGYNPDLEPNQSIRLDLENIDLNYVKSEIVPVFERNGFELVEVSEIFAYEVKELETNWGKRISERADRALFRLVLKMIQ